MDPSKLSPAMLDADPAMTPPQGYKSNFLNPGVDGSNATSAVVVTAFLTVLTVVILLLRLYTKRFVLGRVGWDDYTAIAATIGAVAYEFLIIYVYSHGFGVHQWDVHLATLLKLTDYVNALIYTYKPFMLMAKISLCLFFLNLFGADPKMRWAIYFAIAYNGILQTVGFVLSIFMCMPGRPEYWQCDDKVWIVNVVISAFNIFIDFYLLFLPLFAISRLKLPTGRKIAVFLVFLVGTLACVSSIMGLVFRIRLKAGQEATWIFAPEIITVTFELEATTMVGCFLCLPALFKSQYPLSFRTLWSNRSRFLKRRSSASSKPSYPHSERTLSDEEALKKRTFDPTMTF